jgi:hypothetical protein
MKPGMRTKHPDKKRIVVKTKTKMELIETLSLM